MRCDLAALQQRGIAAGQLGPELGALLRAGGGAVQAQQVGPHLDAQLWQTALRAPPDPAFYLTQSFSPLPLIPGKAGIVLLAEKSQECIGPGWGVGLTVLAMGS